jgi:hypothetical protein
MPDNYCYGIGDDRFMYSDYHQLAPVGSRPPIVTSPQTHEPFIPDREALCTSAQSLIHSTYLFIALYLGLAPGLPFVRAPPGT